MADSDVPGLGALVPVLTGATYTVNDPNGGSEAEGYSTYQEIMDLFEANIALDADVMTLTNVDTGQIKSAARSGLDLVLVTGTAGTSGNLSEWNADGDLVDAGVAASSFLTGITGENIGSLADVTISAVASGELLAWDGAAWINQTLAEAGVATSAQGALADSASQPGHSHTLSDVTDSGALAALGTVGSAQIDASAVTYAKIQNVSATDNLLGRSTAGAGVVEEIACTAAGRALIDDADASAQRTTLGLVIGTNVQAWDADLDTYATKTPPSGDVVGTTDVQTLTNKSIVATQLTGSIADARVPESNVTQHRDATIKAAVNAQTGTTYTLLLTDAADVVTMDNASANTLTIPLNSSVAFPTGTIISIIQKGAGATSVKGATGVTLNGVSAGTGLLTARWSGVSIVKIATDTWIMNGAHGTVA